MLWLNVVMHQRACAVLLCTRYIRYNNIKIIKVAKIVVALREKVKVKTKKGKKNDYDTTRYNKNNSSFVTFILVRFRVVIRL